jgi:hypothetical protein
MQARAASITARESWNRTAELIDAVFVRARSIQDVRDIARALVSPSFLEQWIIHLGLNAKPGVAYTDALSVHASFAMQLLEHMMVTWTACLLIPYYIEYWTNEISRARGSFSAPDLALAELQRTGQLAYGKRVRHIIRTVARALGVPVSQEIKDWLQAPPGPSIGRPSGPAQVES